MAKEAAEKDGPDSAGLGHHRLGAWGLLQAQLCRRWGGVGCGGGSVGGVTEQGGKLQQQEQDRTRGWWVSTCGCEAHNLGACHDVGQAGSIGRHTGPPRGGPDACWAGTCGCEGGTWVETIGSGRHRSAVEVPISGSGMGAEGVQESNAQSETLDWLKRHVSVPALAPHL